jgi:hypothetical protein
MKRLCYASVVVLGLAAGARGDEVLAPGDPPLTRALADRKIDYWEWVFEARLDHRERAALRRLQAEDWPRRDREWKERWVRLLDAWQRATAARDVDPVRLRAVVRRVALDELGRGDGDVVGRRLLARRAADPDAVRLEALRLRQEQHDLMMRTLSDAQARHHETMMRIIGNLNPGRYEYNPATGRYDRYVPNP